MARWLVAESEWGTVSTISRHLGSAPYGYMSAWCAVHAPVHMGGFMMASATSCRNLVSYSDGVNSTGRLLFYLTALDATAADLEVRHANLSRYMEDHTHACSQHCLAHAER